LWAYQRVFHGEPDEENRSFGEMTWREGLVMAPLLGLIVFLGVYPKPMLERMEPSVDRLIAHVEDNSDFREPTVAREGPREVAEGEEGDE
jgi:NADH-quinone oxidoreductase subunit M